MKKRIGLLLVAGLFALCNTSLAQMVGSACFLQGQYLEVGLQRSGAMGMNAAPSSYHPRGGGGSLCSSSTRVLASVYDWGHDGWSTGTPAYMGDYTVPGTPWEEWSIEVGGTKGIASALSCGFTGGGSLTGGFTSFTSAGGSAIATWAGTFMSGDLAIRKTYRVDTFGSALVVNVVLENTSSSAMTGVYYMRTCDPDNNQTISGGSFTTSNTVVYQDDFYHRVLVSAGSTGSSSATGTPATALALGAKDCRAKALWYNSWPLASSCGLAAIWAGSASCLGGSSMTVGSNRTSDIAIGIVFNIGSIPPGDSAVFCYSYIYNGSMGIDSAFPEPTLDVAGSVTDSLDTVLFCDNAPTYLPLNILNGTDGCSCSGGWSWSPATGLSSVSGSSVVLDESAVTTTTVYTITGTSSTASCRSKEFYLTVIPVSTTPPTCRDTTYCLGITAPSLTYNVSTSSGTLIWYTTATGGTGSTTPPTITTSAIGTYTYWVSQMSPGTGCESPRVPITITIAAAPSVTLTNNGPLCPGDPLIITLYDTSTSSLITYSWTGPGTFTSTSRNIVIGSSVYADSGAYSVVVNNNGCLTLPTTTIVVVHSTPPSPTFTNPTYCQYVTASPLNATGSNILWYTSATGGVGSTVAPTPSTAFPGTFTFYVTQTINNCESARYPVVVTVNPKPAPPVITNPGQYCPNAPFLPFSIGAGTGSVLWYTSMTGGTGSSTPPIVSTANPGTYYVYASQTLLGCEGDRTAIPIVVFDSVKAHFTPTVNLGCSEDTVILSNHSYGAINYLWNFGDGYSSIATSPLHIYPTQGTYVITLYAHSLHCVDSLSVTIDTRHPLQAQFDFAPAIVCQGSPVVFHDTSTATSPSYLWIFDDGTTSTAKHPTHIYTYTGTYHVKQIVTDLVPCVDTAYGTVTVDSLSPIAVTISDTAFCRGAYVTMSADYSNLGHTSLVWNYGNGDSVVDVNPVTYAYFTVGSYTVTTTSYYRVCPPAVTTHTISVFNVPTIDLGPDTAICTGSAALTLIDYINASNPSASWLWNTGETTPYINITSSGSYSAAVRIGGCIAVDTVEIRNDCHVVVPNCFSPNRDGVNDYFNPREYFDKGIKTFSMRIFNRWGQVIFESNNTFGKGWDGSFNDVPQPEGVYVYQISATFFDGQSISKTGNLTLIK